MTERERIEKRIEELAAKVHDMDNFPSNPLYFHVPYDPMALAKRKTNALTELASLRSQLQELKPKNTQP